MFPSNFSNSAVRTSGSYHLPCWRLNVTVNSTGISTWLRTTYHVKGYEVWDPFVYPLLNLSENQKASRLHGALLKSILKSLQNMHGLTKPIR